MTTFGSQSFFMIHTLQILRGIAALLVVFYHVRTHVIIPHDSWFFVFASIGYAGVNLFFIISGFIMCYTTGSHNNPWKFIGRRLVRIVPLYWLLLLFHTGVHSLTDPQTYLSMLFIPLEPDMPPFLGYATWMVGWTLNYEMFFYLLFFVSLFVGRYRYVLVFTILAALHVLFIYLSGVGFLQSFDPYTDLPSVDSAYLYMIVSPMMLLFAVGMIAAFVYKRFKACPDGYNIATLLLSAFGIVVFFVFMNFDGHGVQTSFFCLMLFVAALSVERFITNNRYVLRSIQPFVYLGTISYSIYLLHLLFIGNFHIPELPLPEWMKILMVVAATIIASAFSYEMIEKRLSGRLKRLLRI